MLHSNMWVAEEEGGAEADAEGVKVKLVDVAVLPVVSLIIPIIIRLDMSDIWQLVSNKSFNGQSHHVPIKWPRHISMGFEEVVTADGGIGLQRTRNRSLSVISHVWVQQTICHECK
jgi:hypothetical protein